jgi:hypothetical protein
VTRAPHRAAAPRRVPVLPMEIRIGDRLSDADGEWDVVTHPAVFHDGHVLSATVRRVGPPREEKTVHWPAHQKILVRRAAARRVARRPASRRRGAMLAALLVAALLLIAGAGPAQAHWHGGVWIGLGPFWWGAYPYPYGWYPPPYSVYPPVVTVEPPVYVQAPPPPPAYWYYCAPSQTYYPYVETCTEPWIKVPPRLP